MAESLTKELGKRKRKRSGSPLRVTFEKGSQIAKKRKEAAMCVLGKGR
jgi:hypothetical protein